MRVLSRAELLKSLEKEVRPLYLLLGTEAYLRSEAADAIAAVALAGTLLREFNETSYSLFSVPVQTAIAAAEQLPMMADHRVVKITDFAKLKEADEDALIAYVRNPAPSTVFILSANDLDRRKKATKTLLDECVVVDFSAIKDGEATAWATDRLKKLGATADNQTMSEILRLVGPNIQTLLVELDKLAAAAAPSGRITSAMVDDLIGRSRELSNFDLGDQIVARDRKRALETLHRLLDDDVEPLMLLGLIGSNYHRLALGKHLLMRGSKDDVFRNISLPPYKRDLFLSTLQRLDVAKITRGIQRIAEVDVAIKTSQGTPRLQLEMLVCELAG